jgi:hypothetical protein
LLAEHRALRPLSPAALSRRTALHFTNLSTLVRTVRYALVTDEIAWPRWSELTLARWIEANVPAFQACLTRQAELQRQIDDLSTPSSLDEDIYDL